MSPVRNSSFPRALVTGSKYTTDDKGFTTVHPDAAKKLDPATADYLPSWNKNEHYEPYQFEEHHDPALRADAKLANLLPKDRDIQINNISPKLGTEIIGVQLSELSDAAKDELALLASQRGVVVFRDQDFVGKGPEYISNYAKHFGPTHIHPTSGAPKTQPDIHVVLSGDTHDDPFENNTNLVRFHSDVSYELNPTSVSFLAAVSIPASGGGDTVFANNVEAYNRLSPLFKQQLEKLSAVHSAVEQANFALINKGVVKRDPVENIHPVVRVTPTGQKVLYVNRGFTRSIVGYKKEESDYLLNFLFDHIQKSSDLQIRVNWKPNSVAVFDNRVVSHSAILDFDPQDPRLIVRVSGRGERPVGNLDDLNKPDENRVYEGPEYLGNKLKKLEL